MLQNILATSHSYLNHGSAHEARVANSAVDSETRASCSESSSVNSRVSSPGFMINDLPQDPRPKFISFKNFRVI